MGVERTVTAGIESQRLVFGGAALESFGESDAGNGGGHLRRKGRNPPKERQECCRHGQVVNSPNLEAGRDRETTSFSRVTHCLEGPLPAHVHPSDEAGPLRGYNPRSACRSSAPSQARHSDGGQLPLPALAATGIRAARYLSCVSACNSDSSMSKLA